MASSSRGNASGLMTDYTENVSFLLFLLFWGFNHHNEPCHRHKDISFYHILSIKISPPRMTGKLPASGHWRFRGTMTPSRSEQAAPLAARHTGWAYFGAHNMIEVDAIMPVA